MGAATIDADVKKLVLARLDALPSNVGVAVGSKGSFTKDELATHISNGDEIGQMFIELDMQFLKALKEGALFEEQDFSDN